MKPNSEIRRNLLSAALLTLSWSGGAAADYVLRMPNMAGAPPTPGITISRMTPTQSELGGGGTLTVYGSGFTSATAVAVGGLMLPAAVVSASELSAVLPSRVGQGAGHAEVTVSAGRGNTVSAGTIDYQPLAVAAISPGTAMQTGGGSAVISGTGFDPGTYALFGSVAASCAVNSFTQLACDIPPQAAPGAVSVTLHHPSNGRVADGGAFSYVAPTVYTAWNPADAYSNARLSNANKTMSVSDGNWGGTRGLYGKSTGSWYFETTFAGTGNASVGVASTQWNKLQVGHTSGYSIGLNRSGNFMVDGGSYTANIGSAGAAGDTIGIGYDGRTKVVYAQIHKASTGQCSSLSSRALAGYWSAQVVYPAVSVANSATTATINSGETAFKCAPPSGYNWGWWQ